MTKDRYAVFQYCRVSEKKFPPLATSELCKLCTGYFNIDFYIAKACQSTMATHSFVATSSLS
jgi:hypothetical protein